MRDKSHENAYIYTEAQHQQAIDEAVISALDEVEEIILNERNDFTDYCNEIQKIKAKHAARGRYEKVNN